MREHRNEQGQLHRLDGPAYILPTGYTSWYTHGKRHREDGPAVEWPSGKKEWFQNDKCHRTDGPAVTYSDGSQEWWLNGKQVDQLTHMLLVNQHNTQTHPQTVVL